MLALIPKILSAACADKLNAHFEPHSIHSVHCSTAVSCGVIVGFSILIFKFLWNDSRFHYSILISIKLLFDFKADYLTLIFQNIKYSLDEKFLFTYSSLDGNLF